MTPRKGYLPFIVPHMYWQNNQDLTHTEAAIMYLRDIKQMQISEIAKELDRTPNAINTQYQRVITRRTNRGIL